MGYTEDSLCGPVERIKSAKSRVDSVMTRGSRAVSPLFRLTLALRGGGLLSERRFVARISSSCAADVTCLMLWLLPVRVSVAGGGRVGTWGGIWEGASRSTEVDFGVSYSDVSLMHLIRNAPITTTRTIDSPAHRARFRASACTSRYRRPAQTCRSLLDHESTRS